MVSTKKILSTTTVLIIDIKKKIIFFFSAANQHSRLKDHVKTRLMASKKISFAITTLNESKEDDGVSKWRLQLGCCTFQGCRWGAGGDEGVNSGEGPLARLVKGLDAEHVRGRLI